MRTPIVPIAAAVLACTVAAAAVAQPAQQRVRVRGAIVSADASSITISTNGTQEKVALTPSSRVRYVVPLEFDKIAPGSFVGSAAVPQPDGSLRAIEVHVIPGNGVAVGQEPSDAAPQATMNNAPVGAVDAQVQGVDTRTLTLRFKDGEKKLVVPKGTPIATYEPADLKALVQGAHVSIIATRGTDGSLSAVSVGVGKNGYTPAM